MSQPNGGNSGKGYDVTSSGNNSQVAKFWKFGNGSMVLTIAECRVTTTALETTLPAARSQPMATPITTLTMTVSESTATCEVQYKSDRVSLVPATRELLLQQPQWLHVLQQWQRRLQVHSIWKVAIWPSVSAGKGGLIAHSDD